MSRPRLLLGARPAAAPERADRAPAGHLTGRQVRCGAHQDVQGGPDMTDYKQLYIGGEWVDPAGQDRFDVVNPATLEVIGSTPEATEADVDRAVAAARAALETGPWADRTAAERHQVMVDLRRQADRGRRRAGQPGHRRGRRHDPVLALRSGRRHEHGARLLHQPGQGLRLRRGAPGHARPGARAQGARRCGRRHHPLERAAVHHDAEVRADPGARARRWCSSPRPRRRCRRSASPSWPTRPACPPACSTSCPPTARSASTWSATPASTRSRSPAPPPPAARSAPSAASSSSAAPSSSAASPRRSSSTTPTSPGIVDELLAAGIMNNGQACVAQTRILAPESRYDEIVRRLHRQDGRAEGRRPDRLRDRRRPAHLRAPA